MRPWRYLRPVSLRVRLALALAVAAALPLLGLMGLYTSREMRALQTTALNDTETHATALARHVADDVSLQRAAVVALAEQPGLMFGSPETQRQELLAAKRAYPDILSYALFDGSGIQLARSDDVSNTIPIAGFPVFELARSRNQPSLDVLLSSVFQRPVLAIGAPVRDAKGNFAGLVSAALPTKRLSDSLEQQSASLGRSGRVYLVDAQGRVIAHPEASLVASFADLSATTLVSSVLNAGRESGSLSYQSPTGEQLAGYARVPGLSWVVIVELSAAEAFSGLRRIQESAVAILALFLALTGAGGLVLAGSVTAPLRTLLSAVQTMPVSTPEAQGEASPAQVEKSALLPVKTDVKEVVELAAAFESLQERLAMRTSERERAEASLREAMGALGHANEDLERQVANRTEELHSANERLRSELAERQRAEGSLRRLTQRLVEREISLNDTVEALRNSEARLRRLVESGVIGVIYSFRPGLISDANDAFLAMVGYTREDLVAGRLSWQEMTPREYAAMDQAAGAEATARGACSPYEKEYIRKDGSRVPVLFGFALLEGTSGDSIGFAVDISARKRAEAERERLLRENAGQRELLARLVDSAPIGIAVLRGADCQYQLANPAYLSMIGKRREHVLGRKFAEVLPASAANFAPLLDRARSTGETVSVHGLSAVLSPGDREIYRNVNCVPLRNVAGSVDNVLLLINDVTRQVLFNREIEAVRAAETQARIHAEQLATERAAILTSMTEGLVIADLAGNVVHMNPEALRIHGFSGPEEAERPIAEYAEIFEAHYLDGRPMPFELWPINRALRGETFSSLEIMMRRIGSGEAWIGSYGGAPVRGADGSMVLAIFSLRDVTRQKQMEWDRELLLSQVQEAAAELAEREAALSAARDELERRVYERTRELSTANQRLRMLYDISQAILSVHSPAEIAQAAIERLGDVLACHRMSVVMFEPESGQGRILAASGTAIPSLAAGQTFSLAAWTIPDALRSGQIHVSTDLACDGDPVSTGEAQLSVGLSLRIQAPLMVGGELIGTLDLLTAQPCAVHQDAEEIVRQVALSLAVAIFNARLDQQVQASRAQLLALSRRLVEVQENERRAIARELHDEAGQALTTLMIGLGLLAREVGQPDAVLARVDELKHTTDSVLENLHSLAVNLRPASLDRLGLLPALRQYVETFRRQSGLDVVLEEVGLEGERLSPEVETTVYRVVQEAMTNVARHAQAHYVGVLLERRVSSLVVIVEDDGIGFNAEEAIQRGRLGLVGMRERAEMVGGTLTVESTPGQGATLFIEVPA